MAAMARKKSGADASKGSLQPRRKAPFAARNPASRAIEPLTLSNNPRLGMDVESLKESFVHNLEFALAKDEFSATARDNFNSLALTVRDRLIERWIETQQSYYRQKCKRVYYLSLEFLIGRDPGQCRHQSGPRGEC